jgi:hypothetical protein
MWGFSGGTILYTTSAVISLLVGFTGAGLGLDCLGELYAAYRRAALRLEDERWLLDNCKDPVFFSKMRAHPTVCNQVEANARIGAFWAALKEVTDVARVAWQPYILTIITGGMVLLPLCWVCAGRMSAGRAVRRRRYEWGECIPLHDDFRPRIGYGD